MDTISINRALNRPDEPAFSLEENIWGVTVNDENEYVTLSVWFKGDKRDGIDEVFYKCETPPSKHLDDSILDLIKEKTGLEKDLFKGAKFIRIHDEKVEKEFQGVLNKLPIEEIDDLQLILSLAQVMAEKLDEDKSKTRFAAIDRWQSRAIRAKVSQRLKTVA